MQTLASIDTGSISVLMSRLPTELDLDATARQHRALLRSRKLKSGAALLHLALAYAAGALSLRNTAAWAKLAGLADMSDVAVLGRLCRAGEWLRAIVAAILAARDGETPVPGPQRRVRLIDATTVSAPGSAGADWRLHVDYDLLRQRLAAIELTDGRGSESLGRFAIGPGDIALGDRNYAKARDLRQVVENGGDFLVRIGWNALRLHAADGSGPFKLFAALERLAPGEQAEADVLVLPERSLQNALPVRLIMLRLPAAQAEQSRARAKRRGSKQGKRTQPQTLLAAEYVLLVTSLEVAEFPAADLLALYRRRWQIELAFKRLKSLIGLDELRADDPDLARTWLYAKLIAALLTEDLTRELLDSSPCAARNRAAPFLLDLASPGYAV